MINFDKLTYAAVPESLAAVRALSRYKFIYGDVTNAVQLASMFAEEQPDCIVHLAAETHVDRSIDDATPFVQTNVAGTVTLLSEARRYWTTMETDRRKQFRHVHVSTDEVFGSAAPDHVCDEQSPYRPNSPYAASKAAADHFVRAWSRTYGYPACIAHCSNAYGPWQFPEKLIPLSMIHALSGHPIGLYGRGTETREWTHVEDLAQGLLAIVVRGQIGENYVLSSRDERTNLSVVNDICAVLDQWQPRDNHQSYAQLCTFVPDRPGHDRRYASNPDKARRELAWQPRIPGVTGLRDTVRFFMKNREWWQAILDTRYAGGRLGTPRSAPSGCRSL